MKTVVLEGYVMSVCSRAHITVHICVSMWTFVFVSVTERERESVCVCVCVFCMEEVLAFSLSHPCLLPGFGQDNVWSTIRWAHQKSISTSWERTEV